MALELRPRCERCGASPRPASERTICSYECTLCAACAEELARRCPSCAGEPVRRLRRADAA